MSRPALIHCSYHKCLTVYYRRVMDALFNRCLRWSGGYRHYYGDLDAFERDRRGRRVVSINNRALDLDALPPFRISRFVRDPRDLVVSGYHYHKRGAEPWTTQRGPTEADWYFANGNVPEAMRGRDVSFAEHLQSLSEEEGLLAELEFRRRHFESMAAWPAEHPDIRVYRYEEVLGDEERVFGELFAFYGFSALERGLGRFFARRYSLARLKPDAHVRNPSSGQWRAAFTPRVQRAFDERHGGLVRALGYPEG